MIDNLAPDIFQIKDHTMYHRHQAGIHILDKTIPRHRWHVVPRHRGGRGVWMIWVGISWSISLREKPVGLLAPLTAQVQTPLGWTGPETSSTRIMSNGNIMTSNIVISNSMISNIINSSINTLLLAPRSPSTPIATPLTQDSR